MKLTHRLPGFNWNHLYELVLLLAVPKIFADGIQHSSWIGELWAASILLLYTWYIFYSFCSEKKEIGWVMITPSVSKLPSSEAQGFLRRVTNDWTFLGSCNFREVKLQVGFKLALFRIEQWSRKTEGGTNNHGKK